MSRLMNAGKAVKLLARSTSVCSRGKVCPPGFSLSPCQGCATYMQNAAHAQPHADFKGSRACCAKHWDTWHGLRPAQLLSACCRYRQDVSGLQVGLDIDPFALKASEDNAALNGVRESMTVLPTTAKLVVSGQCQVSRLTAEAPARPHVYV